MSNRRNPRPLPYKVWPLLMRLSKWLSVPSDCWNSPQVSFLSEMSTKYDVMFVGTVNPVHWVLWNTIISKDPTFLWTSLHTLWGLSMYGELFIKDRMRTQYHLCLVDWYSVVHRTPILTGRTRPKTVWVVQYYDSPRSSSGNILTSSHSPNP